MTYPMSERYALERMRIPCEQIVECAESYIESHGTPRGSEEELSAVMDAEKSATVFLERTKEA